MSTELMSYSEAFAANAKIYYELAIDRASFDRNTKLVMKGMGNIVIDIAAFIAFSVEKDGKIETKDAVTYAISKINSQFSMIPNETAQCMTATVDLALAAEAAFSTYGKSKMLNVVPGVGNKAFLIIMIYHALVVTKAAMSFKEQCFTAFGSDQLIYVRGMAYMGRMHFA